MSYTLTITEHGVTLLLDPPEAQTPQTEPATTGPAAERATVACPNCGFIIDEHTPERTVAVGSVEMKVRAFSVPINGVPHELAYISQAEREVIDAIRDGLGRFQWNHVPNPPDAVGTLTDMGGRVVPAGGWIKWDHRELVNHGVMPTTMIDVLTGKGEVYSNQPRSNFGAADFECTIDIASWRPAWRKPEDAGHMGVSMINSARREGYDEGYGEGFRAGYEKARQIHQGKG